MGEIVHEKCCFIVDLKKGCFIIAYMQLIICVCIAIACIVVLALGGDVMTEKLPDPQDQSVMKTVMVILAASILFAVVFQLIFLIILVVGLHKNKPKLVKVYLVFVYINLVFSILGFIKYIFSGEANGVVVVVLMLNYLLTIYIIIVIRSQHKVMIDNLRPGPAINNAA